MTGKIRALVVEDQMMVGFALKSTLDHHGIDVVGPCAGVADAMSSILAEHIDVAVLDINLGDGVTSEPVADALMKRDTPFVFLSGYGSAGVLPERFDHVVRLTKPVRDDEVVDILHQLSNGSQS